MLELVRQVEQRVDVRARHQQRVALEDRSGVEEAEHLGLVEDRGSTAPRPGDDAAEQAAHVATLTRRRRRGAAGWARAGTGRPPRPGARRPGGRRGRRQVALGGRAVPVGRGRLVGRAARGRRQRTGRPRRHRRRLRGARPGGRRPGGTTPDHRGRHPRARRRTPARAAGPRPCPRGAGRPRPASTPRPRCAGSATPAATARCPHRRWPGSSRGCARWWPRSPPRAGTSCTWSRTPPSALPTRHPSGPRSAQRTGRGSCSSCPGSRGARTRRAGWSRWPPPPRPPGCTASP